MLARTRSYYRMIVAVAAIAAIALLAVAVAVRDGGSGSIAPETRGADADSPAADGAVTTLGEAEQPYAAAPDAVAGQATGRDDAPAPPAGIVDDRKIVRTAALDLRVEDVGHSFQEVDRIATGAGGFVANSTFTSQEEGVQTAAVTIRVPGDRYGAVLAQLRDLGVRVESESSDANDVTAEFTDLQARLRALEATEAQLLQFLARADDIGEVLQVQDRLNAVRIEIEQVQGRINMLDRLSDLATITVRLVPVALSTEGGDAGDTTIGDAVSDAWESSLEFLEDTAAAVLTVVVFAWWALPLAIPTIWAARRWTRSRPEARATEG